VLANIKTPVTEAAVNEYVAKIRAGVSAGNVFPARISECDFTPAQREKIRLVKSERKASLKNGTTSLAPVEHSPALVSAAVPESTSCKTLKKLRKILYLQGGTCFFVVNR
jgi:hypothetical protein